MIGLMYLGTMNYWRTLLLGGLICMSLPATAQFRAEKRSADKAFELHAYHLAIEGYQRALDYRQDDGESLARLGDAYRMLNKLDSAQLYYARAMKDRRVVPSTLLGYAQTLKSLGMYAAAAELFRAYGREQDSSVGSQYASSCDFAMTQQFEDAGYSVNLLSINSGAADFGPNLPQNGQFFFGSGRIDEDFSGAATNRPYVAQLIGATEFSTPAPVILRDLVKSGSIGPVSYSPDGTEVVFSRNNFTPGTRMVPEAGITLSLMIAEVNEAGEWINVRPLPMNGNDYNTGFGSFGPDGNTLYFASDRPGGFGGFDVYRVARSNNDWQATPENLGPTVNSRGHEITPYYNGRSLYFSSDWHQGLGAYDVFRAAMEGERPTRLFHLGGAVNSGYDDFGFVYDATASSGYVTSNRAGGRGQEDLYAVRLKQSSKAGELSASVGVAPGPEASVPEGIVANTPVPFGTVRGYVTDIQTSQPVAYAEVRVTQRSTGRVARARTDTQGAYYVNVEPATTYDVNVEAVGYESMTFPVTTDDGNNADAFGNILILPVQDRYEASRPVEETGQGEIAPPPPPTVPEATTTETGSPSTTVRSGFAVQLASLANAPELSNFSNTAPVGRVYVTEAAGRFRVKLGPYPDREAALVAAREAKNLGYAGSFVVAETGGVSASSPAVTTPPTTSTTSTDSPYRVQLGAFGKPENFDRQRAERLGKLGSERRGELTVFYVLADDLETARSVQQRAVNEGYSGAYVLQLTDGNYSKL